MINFIIYEPNLSFQKLYRSIILKFIGPLNYSYRFYTFKQYSKQSLKEIVKLGGKSIFILAEDANITTTIDFAKEIRDVGFWFSPIIVCSKIDIIKNLNGILPISFVNKKIQMVPQFNKALRYAIKVLNRNKFYRFKQNNEIYQIPLNQILYFEKNLNDNSTNIITKEKQFTINKSISLLERELMQEHNFFKTHRSCIVNLDNIKSIDFTNNIIKFHLVEINLLSRTKKKPLKELFACIDDQKS